jgi:helicase
VGEVDTLFLHELDGEYLVTANRDGDRLFRGRLTPKETGAGPRPGRFRIRQGSSEEPRQPEEFVELARLAARIRISEQTSPAGRRELRNLLSAYQEEATVVRTCRYCAESGRYSPVTEETAIEADGESICPDCAKEELERELAFRGDLTGAARDRLEELLLDVQDLGRITDLLKGRLDPDLTKFDEISATTEDIDDVPVSGLDVHPDLLELVSDRFDTLLPVQSLSVREGLLSGTDQLVVSATATGKTLIGELAGIDRILEGEGKLLFLVPLVALANQTYEDLQEEYGHLAEVTIRVGASRIRGGEDGFDPAADVIVGTYEGIDHALRTGRDLGNIGTVVIDEVHTLADEGRGHRLDGLISRLKYYCGEGPARGGDAESATQWIYLSATVGNPGQLGEVLEARTIEFEERPVPIERHVTFSSGQEKPDVENKLVTREFDRTSSQGYRGQTIVFTNSRRRCHEISRRLEYSSAPYHAGLDYGRRKSVERMFAEQDLAAVVTTAALAAGVDFPASQVIFDSLAMGIEWLTVQEFEQMLGRAGRPDYHDRGSVWLLVEPEGVYHGSMERTEDEVAFSLLKGEMEPVTSRYPEAQQVAQTLANVTVAGSAAKRLNDRMLGEMDTRHTIGKLLEYEFIDGLEPTDVGRVVTTHFLSPTQAFTLLDGIRSGTSAFELVADVELMEEEL